MKIDLTKEQFKYILRSLVVSGNVYGLLGDFVDDAYKKVTKVGEKLEEYLLNIPEASALVKDCSQEENGRQYFEDTYREKIFDDIFEYDDYVFIERLTQKLAEREFDHMYGKVQSLSEEEFHLKMGDLEDRYWKLLNEGGINAVMPVMEGLGSNCSLCQKLNDSGSPLRWFPD